MSSPLWNSVGGGIEWENTGIDEIGKRKDTGDIIIRIDPRYFRPTEVETLLGDPAKAQAVLGWKPRITLQQLISEMVQNDLEHANKDALLQREGFIVRAAVETPPSIK